MLKRIITYVKNKRAIISGFQTYSKYLSAGPYVFDRSMKYLYNANDSHSKIRAELMFQNSKGASKVFITLIKILFLKDKLHVFNHNESPRNFSGTILLPVRSSNGYRDIRIFDYCRNLILSTYSEEKELVSALDVYEQLKDYFPMPQILWSDKRELLIMEELLLFTPKSEWTEDDFSILMSDIFTKYFLYFKDVVKNKDYSYNSLKEITKILENEPDFPYISSKINKYLFHQKFPHIKLHGDLWTSNTLLVNKGKNKKQIYFIDWEFSSELFFLYDFFNCMWLEVYMSNNTYYIEKYMKGDFDCEFEKIFSLFHLAYNRNLKKDYFNIFFLEFYRTRLINFSEREKRAYLYVYKELMKKFGGE